MKIKSPKNEFLIEDLTFDNGFKLPSKKVKVEVYDKKIKEKIIAENFKKEYRKILEMIVSINEDGSEDDALYVRDKVMEFKNSLIKKYEKYLSKNTLNKYLKMILLLEQKIVIPKKHRGR